MKNKFKLAAVLAVILLILGGLATWDDQKSKQEKADEKSKNKLADFKAEDVIELDYLSTGAAEPATDAAKSDDAPKPEDLVQVSAVKKDGVWRLTKPIDAVADGQTIDGLIKVVTEYSYNKVISDKRETWGEYGLLEPPRHVTLRVGGDSPRAFTVYIGHKAPIGYNVYLRTDKDDKVMIGSQHLLVSTSKTLNDFRDKTLLKIDESKLKNFTYQHQGEPLIELTKTDGKYQITKPEKLDADSAMLKDFLDEVNSIRVAAFNDNPDEATKALFAKPLYEITWQGESGEASTLKLAEKGTRLLAAFDPNQRVFGLADEVKTKIKKELNDFRNRRILDPDSLDAAAVEIDGQTYKNIEGNWYLAADADKLDATGKPKKAGDVPPEQANIRAFMVDLEFAKTDRFLQADDHVVKDLAKQPPEHKITLKYHDPAKAPVAVELFKAEDAADKYIVRRSGASYVYRVAKSAFNSMTPSKEMPAPGDQVSPEGDMPGGMPADEDGGGLNLPPDTSKNVGQPDSDKAG